MPLPGSRAPELTFPIASGGVWSLAESMAQAFTIIVFYRGTHCPICKTFLKEIEEQMDDARAQGIEIVAVSMDDAERTARTVAETEVSKLPVGHSLPEATARAWDLYMSAAREGSAEPAVFSEPGLFVVDADGKIFFAQTQSAPFTRPDIAKLLKGLNFAATNNYPARGTLAT